LTDKDFVSVSIEQGLSKYVVENVGLMGDFEEGLKFGRDRQIVLDDANTWHVLDTESLDNGPHALPDCPFPSAVHHAYSHEATKILLPLPPLPPLPFGVVDR
jgi:hypothetical protein